LGLFLLAWGKDRPSEKAKPMRLNIRPKVTRVPGYAERVFTIWRIHCPVASVPMAQNGRENSARNRHAALLERSIDSADYRL